MLVRMPVRMRMNDSGRVPVKVLVNQVHPAEKFRIANDLPWVAGGGQLASVQQNAAIRDVEREIQIMSGNHDRAFPIAERREQIENLTLAARIERGRGLIEQ
jgi:hypothetical protein